MFYVYVLHSESDAGLYIGFSSDLRRRLREHQAGLAAATAHRGPWRLIYYEAYTVEADALGRERFLKSGAGRTYLKKQCRHYFAAHPIRGIPTGGPTECGGEVDADPKPRETTSSTRYLHCMSKPGLGAPSPLDG